MKQFQDLVQRIYEEGEFKGDRTGTGTYSVFGHQMRFDLRKGFPLVTTKFTPIGAIVNELLWFRDGRTNINDPIFGGSKIWDEWALPEDFGGEEEYTLLDLLNLYAKKENLTAAKVVAEFSDMCGVMTHTGVKSKDLVLGLENIESELLVAARHKQGVGWSSQDSVSEEQIKDGVTRAKNIIRSRLGLSTTAKRRVVKVKKGSIGPMYGHIWRDFGGVDQLKEVIENLRVRPNSRRHLVSAWDPTKLPDESKSSYENIRNGKGALAPCHAFFQFNACEITEVERANYYNELNPSKPVDLLNYLDRDGEEKFPGSLASLSVVLDNKKAPTHWLDLQLYQRSADVGLGISFNIASYALLLTMIANELNYAPRHYVHTTGDTHIYNNHLTLLKQVLDREPYPLPTLKLNVPVGTSIFDIKKEDIELVGYKSHDKIHLPIAV